ncbi:MAG: TRAM domain-containing protein [Desulfobaccales bacterium]
MLQKMVTGAIMGTICAVSGYLIASQIPQFSELWWAGWVGAAGGLVVAFLTLGLERVIKRIPLKTIFGGTLGLFIGLGIAKLASYPFEKFLELPNLQIPLYIFLSAIFGYIGLVLGGKKMAEVSTPAFLDGGRQRAPLKILDTSVIIDGRIADISETGFLEGTFLVPKFVLEELQYIADSPDELRRTRGRRGLDILKRLQQHNRLKVEFVEDDVPQAAGVDSKLVALALKIHAKILTNDFNLHKVAELQGIEVLNINQLANAMKPAVLPGETLQVQILREGKSQGQGVAYLDDGTMVVIENARRYIGKEVEVAVTSVLQTTAGRMIFSEIKNGGNARKLG